MVNQQALTSTFFREKIMTTIDAYFSIYGFECSAQKITEKLNLQPTDTWLKGEKIENTIRTYDHNGWELQSPLPQSAFPEEHLKWFFSKLPKVLNVANEFSGDITTQISFFIMVEDVRPPLSFDNEIIQKLSFLNAGLEIDIYGLDPD